MSINKIDVAKELKRAVLSQKDLQNKASITEMFWLLTDEADDYDIEADVQELIKQERTKQGLTQAVLAKRSGIAQTNMTYFDNGTRVPHLRHLQKIAHGLGKKLIISFEDIPGCQNDVENVHKANA